MDVDGYIAGIDEPFAAIVSRLRQIILLTAPDVYESIKWSQPVYESDGPFAYIKAFTESVNLGFWRGVDIHDPKGLLQGQGEKMRHIKLTSLADVDEQAFSDYVVQAIQLNRVLGNPVEHR